MFCLGYPPGFFVVKNIQMKMSIDAVFDGDHESAIIFGENIYMKNETRTVRMHFGM